MFGKRKTPVKKEEPVIEEKPDLEVDTLEEEVVESPVEEEIPIPKIKKKPEEEKKDWVQIVSGTLLEGGIHQYVVRSSYSIGAIGEVEWQ